MKHGVQFAIWGALLGAVVLVVSCLDNDLVHRPAYILIGLGFCGFLYGANWFGEELCAQADCQPRQRSNFGLRLASISLLLFGLIWFELFP